jgi:hypothetical protein
VTWLSRGCPRGEPGELCWRQGGMDVPFQGNGLKIVGVMGRREDCGDL